MTQPNKTLHSVMLAGTGSDVGKSVLATALCRIFLQDGFTPAPFKAQNMALNSYATPDGYEIGRAQATQAEACRLAPTTDMNPLLLKPNSEHTTQVVLNGKPIGNRSAYDYFKLEGREILRAAVHEAYDRLAQKHNPIVLEGAGSICELNLRNTDLVNMSMAKYANADVILVADIDRGGVFASAYGSIMLQDEEDRKRIKGIIVNKFRGDLRLFEEGRNILEEVCHVPVLGVVPMFHNIFIDEEDSMELIQKNKHIDSSKKINVAVIKLGHISNFTDFSTLERDSRVNLFYSTDKNELTQADCIIIPGTKSTIADLSTLQAEGTDKVIQRAYKNGKPILGICGGYQMLGQLILDPNGIEGADTQINGLGLLPTQTTMEAEKITRQVEFHFTTSKGTESPLCKGYEIHQGQTAICQADQETQPLTIFTDNSVDGYRKGVCMGTYIHGILDNSPFIEDLLLLAAQRAGKRLTRQGEPVSTAEDFRQRQYDQLAAHVRQFIDINRLYSILQATE